MARRSCHWRVMSCVRRCDPQRGLWRQFLATFPRSYKEGTSTSRIASSLKPNHVFFLGEKTTSYLGRSGSYVHDVFLEVHGEKLLIALLIPTCCVDNACLSPRYGLLPSRIKLHLPLIAPIASTRLVGERVSTENRNSKSFSFHAQEPCVPTVRTRSDHRCFVRLDPSYRVVMVASSDTPADRPKVGNSRVPKRRTADPHLLPRNQGRGRRSSARRGPSTRPVFASREHRPQSPPPIRFLRNPGVRFVSSAVHEPSGVAFLGSWDGPSRRCRKTRHEPTLRRRHDDEGAHVSRRATPKGQPWRRHG